MQLDPLLGLFRNRSENKHSGQVQIFHDVLAVRNRANGSPEHAVLSAPPPGCFWFRELAHRARLRSRAGCQGSRCTRVSWESRSHRSVSVSPDPPDCRRVSVFTLQRFSAGLSLKASSGVSFQIIILDSAHTLMSQGAACFLFSPWSLGTSEKNGLICS